MEISRRDGEGMLFKTLDINNDDLSGADGG